MKRGYIKIKGCTLPMRWAWSPQYAKNVREQCSNGVPYEPLAKWTATHKSKAETAMAIRYGRWLAERDGIDVSKAKSASTILSYIPHQARVAEVHFFEDLGHVSPFKKCIVKIKIPRWDHVATCEEISA